MHSRTSLYRFVRKHVVRHAQYPADRISRFSPALLLDPPAGLSCVPLAERLMFCVRKCFGQR